jgi:cell wall-associated NlpC family hydrolase
VTASSRTFVAAGVVQPGDLLLTRDRRIWAWLIRLGAALGDKPNTWNHVIIASHTDEAGTFWGIEARPGGVGWVDLAPWLANRWTIHNADQPKTAEQRGQIVAVAKGMIGTRYDWAAIAADAMHAIGDSRLWRLRAWNDVDGVPAHVVCSSLATWVYMHVGLAEPVPDLQRARWRWSTPADWAEFILRHGWMA